MQYKKTKLQAVDFFCSGGGMSCGIQKAGIDVIAGIDFDHNCRATYEANIEGAKFIHADIFSLNESELTARVGVKKNDDNMIFIGCSPCQYWSVMRTNKTKAQLSKNLLDEFHRFVKFYNPGTVLVENVPGILNRKNESNLDRFVNSLTKQGYKVLYEIVNLNDYGIPQTRKRFSLIASRISENIAFPKKSLKVTTVRDFIGKEEVFPLIPSGYKDSSVFMHTTANLRHINIERLKMTPHDGGTRAVWENTDLQIDAYKKKNVRFKETYSRMFWDQPAPTITTKFFSISNGRFAHPNQDRAISLREGATLQTFPLNYQFIGTSIAGIARMIGNAVPPLYAKQLGNAIKKIV